MINVCAQCGAYRADKTIDPSGPYALCPECGAKHPFLALPLLVVGGASGTGKSTICAQLTGRVTQAVLLDADILWRPEFDTAESNYRDFFETWLRVCKNISQSGRPVVLFGAGLAVPENLENCVERRYFSALHYLALTCADEALSARLRQRPAWRASGGEAYIEEHLRFNRWFEQYGRSDRHPSIRLLDTTHAGAGETARAVEAWIDEHSK